MKPLFPILLLAAATVLAFAADAPGGPPPNPLVWDALAKTSELKSGEIAAKFIFKVTNTSDQPVTILLVRPSCGCTVVDLPADPWTLAPRASGELTATVDVTSKEGTLTKSLMIGSTVGQQTLLMHIKTPPMNGEMRSKNQELARADRQAIFRGSCVQCHVTPTMGKTGADLFHTACLICHTTTDRASMVPDLLTARGHRDAAWWRTWITEGRDGTLMPAFAQPRGILTPAEIESLVEFALAHLPTEAKPN